jgi:NAD+ synthase (glutamine-hydrolysing)
MICRDGVFIFMRVASAAPELRVADVDFNAAQMRVGVDAATVHGASVILFPALSLTGYTCGDLFRQCALINKAQESLHAIAVAAKEIAIHAIVGVPLAVHGRLRNCAALIGGRALLGILPSGSCRRLVSSMRSAGFLPAQSRQRVKSTARRSVAIATNLYSPRAICLLHIRYGDL